MFRQTARLVALAAAALTAASAQAAVYNYGFKTFYDASTWYNPFDQKTLTDAQSVALLKIEDVAGGAKFTLTFNDTDFPSTSKGLFVDNLFLEGNQRGSITKLSGDQFSGRQYRYGFFTPELERRNWNIDYTDNAFKEGETSSFTILGNGISAASFIGDDPILELANVGTPYNAPFGLNKTVRFVGTQFTVPEPSTYALMGLGLVGIAFVARKKRQAV
jgi:PEP-CTERM motif